MLLPNAYLAQTSVMVALTFGVCAVAAVDRVREIRQRRIPLSALARAVDVANTLKQTQSMDNFNNLLQMPILFYVLCLTLANSGIRSAVYDVLLWLYVLLRVGHSLIQLTHNQVQQRFLVWMTSNVALCLAWLLFVAHQVSSYHAIS